MLSGDCFRQATPKPEIKKLVDQLDHRHKSQSIQHSPIFPTVLKLTPYATPLQRIARLYGNDDLPNTFLCRHFHHVTET